jgi:hypothetical protein
MSICAGLALVSAGIAVGMIPANLPQAADDFGAATGGGSA